MKHSFISIICKRRGRLARFFAQMAGSLNDIAVFCHCASNVSKLSDHLKISQNCSKFDDCETVQISYRIGKMGVCDITVLMRYYGIVPFLQPVCSSLISSLSCSANVLSQFSISVSVWWWVMLQCLWSTRPKFVDKMTAGTCSCPSDFTSVAIAANCVIEQHRTASFILSP